MRDVSHCLRLVMFLLFFFNDTATTEIYTLSLHDALPILLSNWQYILIEKQADLIKPFKNSFIAAMGGTIGAVARSEEHTSELQSHSDLVCRLLLEKKKELEAHPREVHRLDWRRGNTYRRT